MSLMDAYAVETVTRTGRGTLQADGFYDNTGSSSTYKARVEAGTERIFDQSGNRIIYDYVMYFRPGVTLIIGDKLTFSSTVVEVVRRETKRDFTGTAQYQKVYTRITGV